MTNKNIHKYYLEIAKNIDNPKSLRNKAKDSSLIDISFMKAFSNTTKSLLDLGSGTGLLINGLCNDFQKIVAVEKYKEFSDYIIRSENIEVINDDILNFSTDEKFDVISLFGVMNYFEKEEASMIYRKIIQFFKDYNGILIIKNQMGLKNDVIVNGWSEELNTHYFSEYRYVENEIELLKEIGFKSVNKISIYPREFNRWENTYFYALVCKL